MRFSLKLSVRSKTRRPWHRSLAALMLLATLSASGLVGCQMGRSASRLPAAVPNGA